MREVVFLSWCDRCAAAGRERVESEHTYTIGIVPGENRPGLKVLELCDPCSRELLDELVELLGTHSIPLDPKAIKPPPPNGKAPAIVTGPPRTACEVCGVVITRSSLLNHIWGVHRGDEIRPPVPTKCPQCGKRFALGNAMTVHRIRGHGFSPQDEAYGDLPREFAARVEQ